MKEADIILSNSLRGLKGKIVKLIAFNDKLSAKNDKLNKEKEELVKLSESQKVTLQKLEEQNKVSKIAEYINEKKENKTELKQKINELIREIDKSIALLNR